MHERAVFRYDWAEYRRDTNPRTYIHPESGQVLPSVTALLSAHQRKFAVERSRARLNGLQAGLGDAASALAASRGNALDDVVKGYVHNGEVAAMREHVVPFWESARPVIDQLLAVGTPILIDGYVWTDEYAGTLDLLFDVAGQWLLVDLKSHVSVLPREIHDAQLGGYAYAVRNVYGRDVDRAAVLVARPGSRGELVPRKANAVRAAWDKFMDRVRVREFARKVEQR